WRSDLATTLDIDKDKIHLMSPFIGGVFGGKLFLRADAVLAVVGARAVKRPFKVALPRPLPVRALPGLRREAPGCCG
ncbi:molybdopterin cofactor-binding domain-containing protein, partial [Rhizobium ruizarguesonis]